MLHWCHRSRSAPVAMGPWDLHAHHPMPVIARHSSAANILGLGLILGFFRCESASSKKGANYDTTVSKLCSSPKKEST